MADHKMREFERVAEARFQEQVEKNGLLHGNVEELTIEVQALQRELEESRQEVTRHRARLVQLGDPVAISEVRHWRRRRQTTWVGVKYDVFFCLRYVSYNFSSRRRVSFATLGGWQVR